MCKVEENVVLSTKSKEIELIGTHAVKKVQDDNRTAGVPNVYSVDGKIFYEVADGKITTENPFNMIKAVPNDTVRIGDNFYTVCFGDKMINDSIARDVLDITTKIQMNKYDIDNVVFAVMMNGGVWYSSRLFNRLQNSPYAVEYIFPSKSKGKLSISSKTDAKAFKGKHVFVIEGFSNRGNMVSSFKEWLSKKGAKTVDVCLLFKRVSLDIETLNEPLEIEDSYYVLGCGLESNGKGRNLNLLYKRLV